VSPLPQQLPRLLLRVPILPRLPQPQRATLRAHVSRDDEPGTAWRWIVSNERQKKEKVPKKSCNISFRIRWNALGEKSIHFKRSFDSSFLILYSTVKC
jgi:hypothetical protein